MKVVSLLLVFLLAVIMSGCATKLISNVTPMVGADGKSIRVMAATTRDRTGTELQSQVWQDEDGKVLAAFQGSGPGIVNNASEGTVGAAIQGGSIIGAAALLRPSNTNVSNDNSGSGSNVSATGGEGGHAIQAQGQQLKNTVTNTNVNANINKNTNLNANINKNKGGWVPPGQQKKTCVN